MYLPTFSSLASLALWQSYNCISAREATRKDKGKVDRYLNHKNTKRQQFLAMYCIGKPNDCHLKPRPDIYKIRYQVLDTDLISVGSQLLDLPTVTDEGVQSLYTAWYHVMPDKISDIWLLHSLLIKIMTCYLIDVNITG